MQRSSSTVHENFLSSNTSLASLKDNSELAMLNDSENKSSIYDSAVENSSALKSFNKTACANNNTNTDSMATNFDSSSVSSFMNSSSSINDNSSVLNDSRSTENKLDSSSSITYRNGYVAEKDHHYNFGQKEIQHMKHSESTDTNTSQEEVDPKSQLAHKTIFKTDNPNLSIIEINDVIDEDNAELENSVFVIEEPNDKLSSTPARRSPSSLSLTASSSSTSGVSSDMSVEKRRKKTESLLQSSKQKLNIAIAEASAKEPEMKSGVGDAAKQNIFDDPNDETLINQINNPKAVNTSSGQLETRREIKIYETIEEFERNLPSTVTVLDTPFGSKVYLVGTAHFSEESQDDVSYVIRNVRPDVVMVELCPSRIHILKLDERTLLEEAKYFNLAKIRSIIQAHGYINGVFFIMLLQLSAQIAKDLGMAPGGEFRRAFEEIQRIPGCMLHLGDRPIRITLHRALRALSFWQTIKLVVRLLSNDTISIAEVEECKQKDLLEKLMQEMAGEFPAFSDVFVSERDMFLCHSLQVASLPQKTPNGLPRPVRVVGVVGIGHAKGIAKMWGRVDPEKIPQILEIPPASLSTRICTATIKYSLIGVLVFGAYKLLRPRLSGII